MQGRSAEQLVERFTATFDALQRQNKWAGPTMLRLAALGLTGFEADDAPERLTAIAKILKGQAKWSGPLNSGLRLVLAAMLLRRELDPIEITEATRETLGAFKEHRLKRSTTHAYIAAFLLVVQNQGRPADAGLLARVAAIIAVWKKEHPWLTDQDDYPMAALHAARGEEPRSLSDRVETIYEGLRRARFSRGNQLQLASHLLAIGGPGEDGVVRFATIAAALRRRKVRIGTSRYDEVALLTLIPGEEETLVKQVLEINDQVCATHCGFFTGITKELALSMAVGIVMAHLASEQLDSTADASTLAIAQAAIEAQQAVTACMIAAAVTVTSAGAAAASG